MSLTFSNSNLWVNCAQSCSAAPAVQHDGVSISPPKSDPALEGEAADWLANMVLRGDASSAAEGAGETAPNGWPIDAAMVTHVQKYCDIVRRHGPVVPQHDVTLWGGKVRGRPDAHPVDDGGEVLRVYELKYGWKVVEVTETRQLILAAIALQKPHHRLFSLEIFQPRPFHPDGPYRKWVVGLQGLEAFSNVLQRAADAAAEPKPEASPGHHCTDAYCPRASVCSTLAENIYRVFEVISSRRQQKRMSAAEIGAEKDFLELASALLKARTTGINAELEARIPREFIPGWVLEPGVGHREWTAPPARRQMLLGIDPYKQVELSPAEAESAGASPDVVKLMSQPKQLAAKLKKFDAKKVERAFK